ncbi:MAG: hypothetical protein HY763_14935 [Planctomycetes bacterium]|nr:hypothetical protein [Planctomycetota bacterium]
MAGRPKKMAERVERLEVMSLEFLDEIWESCPAAYRAEYVPGKVDEDDLEVNPVRSHFSTVARQSPASRNIRSSFSMSTAPARR